MNDELKSLRDKTKKNFNRVLPISELVMDRWEKARYVKAGKDSRIYDSCYIFGKPKIGKNVWVGMFTIIDSSSGLVTIGDDTQISAGVQIYTHNSMEAALLGNKKQKSYDITIQNNCYIGPMSIISGDITIGHHSIVGANSFVNKSLPAYSLAYGNPARITGRVKIKNKKVVIKHG